jgi:very-short-patch-repair endonuclease/predicted transcriptional regulator of viral defense system
MGAELTKDPVERRLVRLAVRQHGVVARRQLEALGLGRGAIAARLRTGRLHRIHRGVYAVGLPTLTRNGALMAAVLACGEGAVLSHRSAAELWGLLGGAGRLIHVTVPGQAGRTRPGIAVHRNALAAGDVTTKDGIPVTRPGRTLVDLADVVPRRTLERAMDEAEYLRLDCTGLRPIRGRRGYGLLRAVLAEHSPGTTRTRSKLEDAMVTLCDAHGLPRPEINASLDGYEVDCLWRAPRLIVEADGWAAHGTRSAFERDRARDAALTVAGYRVVRITRTRLDCEPGAVAGQLRALLASR